MPENQNGTQSGNNYRGVVRQKAGTHTRVVSNKKKQLNKKACRKWKHDDGRFFYAFLPNDYGIRIMKLRTSPTAELFTY